MARIIEIEYKENKYVIEFNRRTLLELATSNILNKEEKNIDDVITLLKSGLTLHHKSNMPSDDELKDLLFDIDNLQDFITELGNCIQETANALKEQQGNAKWVVKTTM